jgi:predicted DNA binding CopG/RHH family protein
MTEMDNQKDRRGQSWRSIQSELKNFGEYQPKDAKITLRMSEDEKTQLVTLAENLGVSTSLLVRILVKQAQDLYTSGENPLGDFEP